MQYKNVSKNIAKDRLFFVLVFVFSILTILPLALILFYLIANGIRFVNWELLTAMPMPAGEAGGGIFNAITGSLIILVVSCVIAIPIGILAGLYLSEHNNRLSEIVRLSVDVLQGVPSIIIGIVAYIWFVLPMRSFSALSGGAALAIMMLPVIIKNTEETLKLIPYSLKEAAYALGAPYYRVVLQVVLPAGLSGILTGILLSIARILGETAPLLFTAFGNPFTTFNILKPMETIPHIIFKYATSPYEGWQNIAWGASFILVTFILGLNLISKVVIKKWKVRF